MLIAPQKPPESRRQHRLADAGASGSANAAPPLYLHCDITDIGVARDCVAKVEAALGPVPVLINNAARDDRKEMLDTTPEFWDWAMAVNLRHQFFVTQAVIPGMIGAGTASNRKLSMTVQLSDESAYEGGALQFISAPDMAMPKNRGAAILFPAYLAHRVGDVTGGLRCSLVGWAAGTPFR